MKQRIDDECSQIEVAGIRDFDPLAIVILTGSAYPALAQGVAELLRIKCFEPVSRFPDGEIQVAIAPNLRKREVFIVQPTGPPKQADAILEVLLLIDAARRASAEEITVVQPFASYQRADRKDKPRVPITAALLPQLLVHAGADRLITVDNHSAQQQGYIKEPWDELYASYSLVPAIRELGFSSGVLLSPDAGGTKRADYYAHILTASSLAFIYKRRRRSDNSSIAVELVGDVVGKDVLIVDDIVASGSTVFHAAELAAKCGARRIFVAVAHGLFLGDFLKKLDSSPIEKVLVTNSLPHPIEITQHPKIQVVPIEPLLSEAIRRTYTGESLNEALFPKFDATI